MTKVDQDYQGRSRFGLKRHAVRPSLPARLLLLAPTGAGKTMTSLSIASHLVGDGGEVVMLDTEQQQGEHTASVTYADQFDFELIPWEGSQGFDIRDLTATVNESAKHMTPSDVLIVDGIQPFWTGVGGILDMVEGKFGSWSKVRPFQAAMMEALKTHPSHLVLTCRAKLNWAIQEVEDSRGRTKQHIEMQGVGPQFDQNIVYEMNVALQMDQDHSLTVIKSRTTRLADRTYQAEQEGLFADQYAEWLSGGHALVSKDQRDQLIARFDRIDSADQRRAAKTAFVAEFGDPRNMLAEDHDRAAKWVDGRIAEWAASEVDVVPEPTDENGEAA